ncbi:hypothetical protein ASPVEDRAFT_45822, partial [Aspergillus versicolor CBS 583.65]
MEAIQRLHISIAQTFENCFDTAYRDFNAELAAYDARVKDAEERAKTADEARQRAASEAEVLRHRISLLQEKMRQGEFDSKEHHDSTENELQLDGKYEPRLVLGNKHISDISAGDVERISDRYAELYEQAGMLVQASNDLKNRVKRHKKKLEQWQSLLQHQEFAFTVNGKAVKFQRVESTGPMNPLVLSPRHSSRIPNPLRSPDEDLQTYMSIRNPTTPKLEVDHQFGNDNSGNEWDGTSEQWRRKEHPELTSTMPSDASADELPPDTPTHSGTCAVMRKRKRSTPVQPPGNNLSSKCSRNDCTEQPITIKSETLPSSPLKIHSPQSRPLGTQDLDDIGDTVATPTKRVRSHRNHDLYAPPGGLLVSTGSPSRQHMVRPNCTHEGNQAKHDKLRVLQPIYSNLRNINGLGQSSGKKGAKKPGSITRISSLTEDGDENQPPPLANGRGAEPPRSNQNERDLSSGDRLSDLLEGTPPRDQTFQLGITPNTSSRTEGRRGGSLRSCDVAGTIFNTTPTSKPPRGNQESNLRDCKLDTQLGLPGQMEAIPNDEPYRARPLLRLGLENFKINPDYNNGLDYAYDEVIRGNDGRKCASGCTRPGCCGEKFLAMARFGIPVDASREALNDHKILEEYLAGYKNTVDTLSPEARGNLLVEAKAKVFADRFGKHRHQHHRPGTPPGFWRTEMPGTQELKEDREEAQRLERDKVKERHREAMRPGGRWLFAD